MNALRRLCAHDSTRACLMILSLFAACGLAELICTIAGVPAP